MNWHSRFLSALLARLHLAAVPAAVTSPQGMKPAASRHTAPGFGTLVIGAPRDWPGSR